MAQIIVTADRSSDRGEGAVMMRERVNLSDLESQHFANQLLERLEWALGDAQEVERDDADGETLQPDAPEPVAAEPHSRPRVHV